jgi:isopenicillin N synthase-like dioxygenase
MNTRKVPALSLKNYTEGTPKQRGQFVKDLYSAFLEYGFVVLKNHSVDEALLNKAYSLSKTFFESPVSEKKKYHIPGGGGQRGYTPFGQEHAKGVSVKDLKEFWHVGRELPKGHKYTNVYPANVWPEMIPEFKDVYLKIYEELDQAGAAILAALAEALKLPKGFFDNMMQDGNSILRLLHYPPIPEGVDPRCIRAAAHEDINLITILVSATAAGLELKDKNGEWLAIESDPNNLIVNIGDMLSRITNNVLPSTTHRVVNPNNGKNESRYSAPYFIHPKSEIVLSCLDSCKGDGAKYPDITAGEFLNQRLKEIGLIKK